MSETDNQNQTEPEEQSRALAEPPVTPDPNAPLSWGALRLAARSVAVPPQLRNDRHGRPRPENDVIRDLYALVTMGNSLGMDWAESIRRIDVIDGRPAMSGELIADRILRAGWRLECLELNDQTCTVRGTRWDAKGRDFMMEATFTWKAAERARLTKKFNWQAYPEQMLYWRAVSMLGRMFFADCLAGVKYTPEELGVDDDEGAPIPEETVVEWEEPQDVEDAQVVADVDEEGDGEALETHEVAPPPHPNNVSDLPITKGQKLRHWMEQQPPAAIEEALRAILERKPRAYRNRELLEQDVRIMAYAAEMLGYVEVDPELVFPENVDADWLHYLLKTKANVWHLSAVGKRQQAEAFFRIIKAEVEGAIDRYVQEGESE